MRLSLLIGINLVLCLVSCSSRSGRLLTETLDVPSLAQNRMGIETKQHLAIYLPPSYDDPKKTFPVLYLLPNFNCCQWRYTGGNFQGFQLKEAMDRQIAKGEVREMIVVIPNAVHFLGGSWYRNSPLTGNWEDYIGHDLVEFMDAHYRTIRTARGRALAGHGMGGTGALELAMKHPDVFANVFALSPALFDTNGLQTSGMLIPAQLQTWQANLEKWTKLPPSTRRRSFRDYVQLRLNSPSKTLSFEGLVISYAAAVSPDLSLPYPHIAFPSGISEASKSNLVARFENGFGGWPEKIQNYLQAGIPLHSITLEYGAEGDYSWIKSGADYLSGLMQASGIENHLRRDKGDHESALGRRLETVMLPTVSRAMQSAP